MKKSKFLPILAAVILALFAALAAGIFAAPRSLARADDGGGDYRFEFLKYDVTYDVRTDRTSAVTLDLTVKYLGFDSTGFIYDIPVNGGDRVRNLSACELDAQGNPFDLDYTVETSTNFVSVNIGDHSRKRGETHVYRVLYDFQMVKDQKENVFSLNAVGFGSEAALNNVSITVNMPYDFTVTECIYGRRGGDNGYNLEYGVNGKTLTAAISHLNAFNGVSMTLDVGSKAFTTFKDYTAYYIVAAAVAVLIALILLKLLAFNHDDLTPVVGFTSAALGGEDDPTAEMDPLIVGKLIDNKVDQSDVTSLIYYWADKGYLKIDLQNPDDVELIRIWQKLPDGTPYYQVNMYNKLFASGDKVRISSLTNSFYTTVTDVTNAVNKQNGKLYDGKSMAIAVAFTLIAGLILCLSPIIYGFAVLHALMIAPLFMIIGVFIVFAITQSVKYKTLKFSKTKMALCYLGVAALCCVLSLVYCLIVPTHIFAVLPKFLIALSCFAITAISVSLIRRTDDYTRKLNKIVGFKQFIATVEKQKLEMMLEGNPEFYYHVLPYAIVLGVSDIWADKFEDLSIDPPSWSADRSFSDTLLTAMIFNRMMRNINITMTKAFISRPSSSSRSGFGGFGGFGGGFGGGLGGGHGGGGFRGR